MKPYVSIIIPTYNRAILLHEALHSVRMQTESNWEAIVINNYSEDNTIDIVAAFSDPRIKLLNFKNNGNIGAARNHGVSMARSDWIAFLDSDDTYHPEKIARCRAVANKNFDIINHRFVKVKNGRPFWKSPKYQAKNATYRNMFFKENCLAALTIFVRKSLINKVGGFSEDHHLISAEDRDLWLKFAKEGANIKFIDDILANYRVHSSQMTRHINLHMQASLTVVERHKKTVFPKKLLDPFLVQRERALITYSGGRAHYILGDRINAACLLAKSILIFPFVIKAYLSLVLCCLPIKAINHKS